MTAGPCQIIRICAAPARPARGTLDAQIGGSARVLGSLLIIHRGTVGPVLLIAGVRDLLTRSVGPEHPGSAWQRTELGSSRLTRFEVLRSFLDHYDVHQVGGQTILEYWIPAEDLPALNASLPEIKVGMPSVIDAALLPAFVGLSKAREMVLTGDIYKLDQLLPGSIANVVAEPGELDAAAESLLDRIATHPRTVTAAQRRVFDIWLNNPLDACVNASVTEFAKVFESPDTHEQIARHHKRITG